MTDLKDQHMVETNWLAERLETSDVVVFDGSTHLPTTGRNAKAEYDAEHIPGALFFDINAIADAANPLPHMLPSPEKFATMMTEMGVGNGVQVVAYDSVGLYSAARVWWMFRAMGYDNVAVLNGGLKKWKAEGRPVTDAASAARGGHPSFAAQLRPALVRNIDEVKAIVTSGSEQVIDARGASRFRGEGSEPRKGLRSGHMPGAYNVPFADLVAADGTLKPATELTAIFQQAGVDVAKPATTSCGSGVTAGVLTLALAMIGNEDVAVYDGSWSEWGHESSGTEVVTG